MIDNYIYVIVALLPITSLILVFQSNPYQALVVRAILGAVAALVYAVLGGADVALTEALVGTMLAITLYLVAVRSSFVMRLGIPSEIATDTDSYFSELITSLRKVVKQHYLRLEIVEYSNNHALNQALMTKEVHAICNKQELNSQDNEIINTNNIEPTFNTSIRVNRLFEILQQSKICSQTNLKYVTVSNPEDKH